MSGGELTEFEFLLSALAANVDAYQQAGQRVQRYRAYALCRHQETERHQILRLLTEDLPLVPLPLPFRGTLSLFVHRIGLQLKMFFHGEAMILRDLWAEDLMLLARIDRFVEGAGRDLLTMRYLKVYARLIDDTVQEMAEILQSRLRHADRARAFATASLHRPR